MMDEGMAGDNLGLLLRGIERTDVERGQVVAKAGSITPHTKFETTGVRAEEGRGWAAQCLLQWISSAVLHPDDGCDRGRDPAGRRGDGAAGRQREPDRGADRAGGAGAGLEVRHP